MSVAAIIDSHVHTDDERFQRDIDQVLTSARASGVIAQVVPAISRRWWPRLKTLCAAHVDLYPCYGLHPCCCSEHSEDDLRELAVWLARERPVGIGECGLDYQVAGADKAEQQHMFDAQLALAREFDLPIVIHARKAVEDVIRMIRASGHYRGQIHSFNGSQQQAYRLVDLGYKLSFGGAITYSRAKRLQSLVKELPLEALMLETDAPDQPDSRHAGNRNEPAYLVDILQSISTLRGEPASRIAEITTRNTRDLFCLP